MNGPLRTVKKGKFPKNKTIPLENKTLLIITLFSIIVFRNIIKTAVVAYFHFVVLPTLIIALALISLIFNTNITYYCLKLRSAVADALKN